MFKFDKVSKGVWKLDFNSEISFSIAPYFKDDRYGYEKKYFRLSVSVDGKDRSSIFKDVRNLHSKEFYFVFDPAFKHHSEPPKYFARMLSEHISAILTQLNGGDGRSELVRETIQLFGYTQWSVPGVMKNNLHDMARNDPKRLRALVDEYKRHSTTIREADEKYQYDLSKWSSRPDAERKEQIEVFDKMVDSTKQVFSHRERGGWFRAAFQDVEDATYYPGYDVYREVPVRVEQYKTVANPRWVRPPEKTDVRYHRDRMNQIIQTFKA